MQVFNHLIILICLILVVLCMAAPLQRSRYSFHPPFLQRLLHHHSLYAVSLLVLSLVHGFLSGKTDAMFSGKLAWTALLLLILLALPRKRFSSSVFRKIHGIGSCLVCILIGIHIIHGIFF